MNISGLAMKRFGLYFSFLAIVILILSGNQEGFSQGTIRKASRQSAMEAFSNSEYEIALRQFIELTDAYPKDPLYKYYSGVCLVMLKREPGKAEEFLNEARSQSAAMRSIPGDALFYLGRARQMDGRYTDAIESYNLFTQQSGKKAARDLRVPEYISQCNEKKGQLSGTAGLAEVENKIIARTDDKPDALPVKGPQTKSDSPEKNMVTLPGDYDRLLSEAMVYQVKADSLDREADRMKAGLDKLPYSEKASARARISEIEAHGAHYRKLADQKVEKKELPGSIIAVPEPAYAEEKRLSGNNSSALSRKSEKPAASALKTEVAKDSQAIQEEKKMVSQAAQKPVIPPESGRTNQSDAGKSSTLQVKKQPEVLSYFEVNPKPVFKAGEMASVEQVQPGGLVYRIQVAVFRNPVAVSFFKGVSPAYGYKIPGTDKTTYYLGIFRRSSDAHKALEVVKKKGFKDAFIVASMDGKAVSSGRAAILEKEWGGKSLITAKETIMSESADTVPPVLAFRVEVTRSSKPLKENAVEAIRKVAGNRDFDIIETENKQMIYLIGIFITFESASEYADLLVRNGYPDATVVAWLGKKEIPVDTARQLFEKL
jgi:hypothetical protein